MTGGRATGPTAAGDADPVPDLADDGPTELVETDAGGYVERLATGTATLLLVWLIGTGAGSALLVFWAATALVFGRRLGIAELFSAIGFYVAIYGASGPVLLWLAGRAQGHSLPWFLVTAMKIGGLMAASLLALGVLGSVVVGAGMGDGALAVTGILLGGTLALALVWSLATWSADWYIARARVRTE
ncbi:MAG: hypothetical protein M3295_03975 [Chloroflexota bacterium]|nr:hypothetical protein [Chloroflexota bacterium]